MKHRDEQNLQKIFCKYLDYKNVLYTASLTGVYLPIKYAVIKKQCGVKPGVPDIAIYEPRGKYHGLFIELKIHSGATPEQMKWCKELNKRNYLALIMPKFKRFEDSFNWLCETVEKYLNIK